METVYRGMKLVMLTVFICGAHYTVASQSIGEVVSWVDKIIAKKKQQLRNTREIDEVVAIVKQKLSDTCLGSISSRGQYPLVDIVLGYAFDRSAAFVEQQRMLKSLIQEHHGFSGAELWKKAYWAVITQLDACAVFEYSDGKIVISHDESLPIERVADVALCGNQMCYLATIPSSKQQGKTLLQFQQVEPFNDIRLWSNLKIPSYRPDHDSA